MDKVYGTSTVVAEYMYDILGVDSIKDIAANAYVNNIIDTLPLLPALAKKANSIYVHAIYLLWHQNIPYRIASVALTSINDQGGVFPIELTENSESVLLADILLAFLSLDQLRQFTIDSYEANLDNAMRIVEILSEKTNDIHLRCASILWHSKIPFSKSGQFLTVKNAVTNTTSPVEGANDNDTNGFLVMLCSTLSESELKIIVKKAYADNNINIQQMVNGLFKTTKSRYYKTVLLLLKYKIDIPNGLIILARVDGYCQAKKNKYYIDLCIYKDIYGVIKTGNSASRK